MINYLNNLYNIVNTWLMDAGLLGGVLCLLLVVFESICPILPLFAFVTINMYIFGYILGFILSYIFNIVGCCICYYLVKRFFSGFIARKFKDKKLIKKGIDKFKHMKLNKLVLLIAMPFTPSFLINSFSGLSKMNFKKYLTALLIAKLFVLSFWAFIGIGFVECLKKPEYLIIIVIMLLLGYVVSTFVNKKLDIE